MSETQTDSWSRILSHRGALLIHAFLIICTLPSSKWKPKRGEKVFYAEGMLIDVQIRQPHTDCPIYTWERERECMRLIGIYRAESGLPADLAALQLEGRLDIPILLLTTELSKNKAIN